MFNMVTNHIKHEMFVLCLSRYLQYTVNQKKRKTWTVNKSNRSAVDVTYNIHGPNISDSNKRIIVLHGLLGSKRNWESLCIKIASANNACVIAADARNHGDSPHSSSHTYFDLTSDVSRLMNKLAIEKAHIIGHSMGGRTGMTLALTEHSKVASLVVVDISTGTRITTTQEYFVNLIDVLKSVNFQGADSLMKARQTAKDKIIASGQVKNIKGVQFIVMNVGELPDKTFGWKINLDAFKNNFTNIATFPTELNGKQYTGPTLFIGGGRSEHLPKTDEPNIKKYFPKAELKYIEDAGHNAHADNPPEFLNIVNKFFSKHL